MPPSQAPAHEDRRASIWGLALCVSSSGCYLVSFTVSFVKLAHLSVSLSSVIRSSKLTEAKGRPWEPPVCSWGSEAQAQNNDLSQDVANASRAGTATAAPVVCVVHPLLLRARLFSNGK